jgi:hypothetical protein
MRCERMTKSQCQTRPRFDTFSAKSADSTKAAVNADIFVSTGSCRHGFMRPL